jgi:hypothetical protein
VSTWSSFAADNPDGNAALTRLVDHWVPRLAMEKAIT